MKFQVALLFKDMSWAQRNIDVPDELREDGEDEDIVVQAVMETFADTDNLLHVCILYHGEERDGTTVQDLPKG